MTVSVALLVEAAGSRVEVERGQVAGLRDTHVALGDVHAEPSRDHAEILLDRLLHPALLAALLGVGDGQFVARALEFGVQLVR